MTAFLARESKESELIGVIKVMIYIEVYIIKAHSLMINNYS